MDGDMIALTLFHCQKVGHLGPVQPKMMSLLDLIAIQSLTQIRFGPGPKYDSLPNPNAIRFVDPNTIWPWTQIRFGPRPKCDSAKPKLHPKLVYYYFVVQSLSWLSPLNRTATTYAPILSETLYVRLW